LSCSQYAPSRTALARSSQHFRPSRRGGECGIGFPKPFKAAELPDKVKEVPLKG
jgi:hypothetical protein